MRRLHTLLAVSMLGAAQFGAFAPSPHMASGEGAIAFGKDGHGRGYFLFEMTDDGTAAGSLLFAAEDHHSGAPYPEIIVQVQEITAAEFGRGSVAFSAKGLLHDDEVLVSGAAIDFSGAASRDRFEITCTDPNDGSIVFEARGDVFSGDIVIGLSD